MKKYLSLLAILTLFAGCSSKTTIPEDKMPKPSSEYGWVTDFSTQTLDGKNVTEEMFADYDLTMINIWATWCPPCVNELSELQELFENLDSNVNLISICTDALDARDDAHELVELNGIEYDILLPDDGLNSAILNRITSFPTTIFVDSEGTIVGTPILGAPPKDVVKTYQNAIDQTLLLINE